MVGHLRYYLLPTCSKEEAFILKAIQLSLTVHCSSNELIVEISRSPFCPKMHYENEICLLISTGESWRGPVRKLLVTWGKAVVFTGHSGYLMSTYN